MPERYAIVISKKGDIASPSGGFKTRKQAEDTLKNYDFGPHARVTTLSKAEAYNKKMNAKTIRKIRKKSNG